MKTDGRNHSIQFGSRQIPYTLHRAERKRMRIVVSPELRVDVFSPKTADDEQVRKALIKKVAWISRKLDALEDYHPLPSPKKYISGETVVYLGRQYRLKIENGLKQPAKLMGRFLWVWIKDRKDTTSAKQAVEAWYRISSHAALGRYMDRCYTIASRHGVLQPVMTIRAMKRRWGSCSRLGRITLNINLIQVPIHCIEYVIMHELCHLKHHNHSKAFYSLLTRCQPDWRWRKEALDLIRLTGWIS